MSSRHTKGENSTETDTKTIKQREPNEKYRLGTVSNVNYSWGGGLKPALPRSKLL